MKFLFPNFLFALFTIAIPIIIHFFNFRKFKTVYFSNVGLLKLLKKESRKKSQLKQILILITRILAIISIVLAFSKPYIPSSQIIQNKPNYAVGIYIDNSFSMNIMSEQGQLLEAARNKAIEIAQAYDPGTKFLLITNDLLASHQNFFNKDQFIQQVIEIQPTANVLPISLIYNRIKNSFETLESNTNNNFYFLSDFQRSITDINNLESDTNIIVYFIPFTPDIVNNLYIDTCWFDTPSRKIDTEEELFVKIINNSGEAYQNLPLRLYINDSLKTIANFNIDPRSETVVSLKYLNLKSGAQYGKIEITDYPVTHDNTYFLSYNILPVINALVISDNTINSDNGVFYLNALFKDDQYVKLNILNSNNLSISDLYKYNTIFLTNMYNIPSGLATELEKVTMNGASVVFSPEFDGNIDSYNQFLSDFNANRLIEIDSTELTIDGIDFENLIYKNVFNRIDENVENPKINGSFRFTTLTRIPEQNILWFGNQNKALGVLPHGHGMLFTFSFPLNSINNQFITSLLFVPTIYSIAVNSIPAQEISYTIGKVQYVQIKSQNIANRNYPFEISEKETGESFIPETSINEANMIRFNLTNQISNSGHYIISSGDSIIVPISFNYNRDESMLSYYEPEELEYRFNEYGIKQISIIRENNTEFSEIFNELQNGKQLWKIFIIIALIFILLEAIIIRFWK